MATRSPGRDAVVFDQQVGEGGGGTVVLLEAQPVERAGGGRSFRLPVVDEEVELAMRTRRSSEDP